MQTDPLIGRELEHYRIVRRVGAGGMGVVYVARDLKLLRDVAVKVLPSSLAENAEARQRFQREIRLAAGVEHPNVIPLYDAGYAEGYLFIVMRLISGPDLGRVLDDGPLSQGRALALLTQIASGLACVHDHGLVHRDVKPQNVLIGSVGAADEHAFLTDFGIARAVGGTTVLTRGAIGTVEYMAPELVEWRPASALSDQYALACLLFEALSGHSPFEGLDLPRAHVDHEPPTLRSLVPSAPRALDLAVARALSKSPSARFPSVTAFSDACLEAIRATRDGAEVDPAPDAGRLIDVSAEEPTVAAATALRDEIAAVLAERRRPMTASEIAAHVNKRVRAARPDAQRVTASQVRAETRVSPYVFAWDGPQIRLRG
jgi:serine/threonine-protein kinase